MIDDDLSENREEYKKSGSKYQSGEKSEFIASCVQSEVLRKPINDHGHEKHSGEAESNQVPFSDQGERCKNDERSGVNSGTPTAQAKGNLTYPKRTAWHSMTKRIQNIFARMQSASVVRQCKEGSSNIEYIHREQNHQHDDP